MSDKKAKTKSLLIIGLAIAISSVVGSFTPTNAQKSRQQSGRESVSNVNNGLPSHRRDGGTRGHCAVNHQDFVALIPDNVTSLTASLRPKLYFHVPQTHQPQTIEFVLRDQNDNLVYEQLIEAKGESGIMSVEIPLPANNQAKSLDSGVDYRWYLSNICNPENRSQDIVLEGWIEHQQLSATNQETLNKLNLAEQAKFYQQQGLWYDALAIAAKEAAAKSENISETQWSKLLTNIGLDKFADQPLIN